MHSESASRNSRERFVLPGIEGLVPVGADGPITWHHGRSGSDDALVGVIAPGVEGETNRRRLTIDAPRLRQLQHPGLLPCTTVSENGDRPYICHPWPGDATLTDRCADDGEPLGKQAALRCLIGLAEALDAMERCGLSHLGLLPGRIFLTGETVRIAGLGLSTVGSRQRPGAEHVVLAPEVILGLPADIRADIHSVGVLLVRLLGGRWPWTIRAKADLEAWARAPLRDAPLLHAGGDDALEAVARTAIARSPADRYRSPVELREDLEQLLAGLAPRHAKATIRPPVMPRPGAVGAETLRVPLRPTRATPAPPRPTWTLIAGGAGVAGAVLVGLWLVLPSRARTEAPALAGVAPVTAPAARNPAWAAAAGRDAFGAWADLRVGEAVQRLRYLAADETWMGSPADETGRRPDESRYLANFTTGLWLADSETTQLLYQEVMGSNPSRFRGDDLPVDNVTWNDASDFCRRLSQRKPGLNAELPTEAWWERGCRAGGRSAFGLVADGADQRLWDEDTSGGTPHPVRRLPPNAWGLFDMHGNVLEWTADAMAAYPTEATTDRLITHGAQRVARGGSWVSERLDCRAAARFRLMPAAHFAHLGFRFAVRE